LIKSLLARGLEELIVYLKNPLKIAEDKESPALMKRKKLKKGFERFSRRIEKKMSTIIKGKNLLNNSVEVEFTQDKVELRKTLPLSDVDKET